MKGHHRDSLWPLVNISEGVMLTTRCGDTPAGSRGTLKWFGSFYATVSFDRGIRQVPLLFVEPFDELALRREARRA